VTPKLKIAPIEAAHIRCAVAIDRDVNRDRAWTTEEWYRMHRRENSAVVAAKWGDLVVGAMALEVYLRRVKIYRLLVCPWHRFNGIGKWLHYWALSVCEGRRMTMDVREDDLDAQQFMVSLGFSGKFKTKARSPRGGWRVPETRGESSIVHFSMSAQDVKRRCSRLQDAAGG